MLTTCLWFDGNAEEAAAFWTSLLPDSHVDGIVQAPTDNPSNKAGDVMLVNFTLQGAPFQGINGGPMFPFSEAVSLRIDCADQAEADRYWAALTADGGEEGQCGWCKDRFGFSWQVVPVEMMAYIGGPDPDGAARAMQAMLRMQRLVVEDMRRAYEGEVPAA